MTNQRYAHARRATLAAMRLASVIGIAALTPALAAAEPQRLKLSGATLVVNEAENLTELTLTLERAGKPVWTRRGWKAIAAGKPLPTSLDGPCETLGIGLTAQPLGKRAGARLDVACRNGEDMFTARGAAIVIDTVEPYKLLWVGDGDSVSNENDACITEHHVTFELRGKSLVENTVETSRTNADGSCSPGGEPGKPKKTTSSRVVVP
jgi:hypothetical protein